MKKQNKTRLYAESVRIDKRTLNVESIDITSVSDMYPKFIDGVSSENFVLTIALTSSGNTSAMTDPEIIKWIMGKINK